MKNEENIKNLIKKLNDTTSSEMDKRTLNDVFSVLDESKNKSPATGQNIWRKIMKTKITKLAVAAVIIIGIFLGLHLIGIPIDGASVAWADVVKSIAKADYVHVYYFKDRDDVRKRHVEAWYAYGKMVTRGDEGDKVYDDGQIEQGFNKYGRRTTKGPSQFSKGQTFFEIFTGNLLSDQNEQFNRQIPANVGDDFLIYEFEWPGDDSDFIEGIFITVGKNSLLPIQMKIYHKDGDYDLVMFDYEAPEKPAEFFEPPTVEPPNVRSEVLLDGEEVFLDIEGTPGLKQAIVRLHGKYDGPAEQLPSDYRRMLPMRFGKTYKRKGGPIFKLDVTFVTDEGYLSQTNDLIVLWLNEAQQCGVGSEQNGLDNWPDGKYRNVRFSPLLKSTDREDIYIVEIRCWIKTEEG